MSEEDLLKNLDFLELTDLGKDIILNHEKWYQKYLEKHQCDPFCKKCDQGLKCGYHDDHPNQKMIRKLTHILNQIYWEQVDQIPEGVSIPNTEFIPQVFSKYFTLPEAIDAIIDNWSGAPICGLGRLISRLTGNCTFFEIKRCAVCDELTGPRHYWECPNCQESSCLRTEHCWDCRTDYCQKCIIVIDKPIPKGYISSYCERDCPCRQEDDYICRHYGQCSQCRSKHQALGEIFPDSVVDGITKYQIGQ